MPEPMNREEYLKRLDDWLAYKVAMGLIGEDVAEELYGATVAYIEEKRITKIDPKRYREQLTTLPFVEQISVPDWEWEESWNKAVSGVQKYRVGLEEDRRRAEVEQYQTSASKSEYESLLRDYLKGANVKGERAEAIVDEANRLIDLGVPVNQLPNVKSVIEHAKTKAEGKRAIGEANPRQIEQRRERETLNKQLDVLSGMQYTQGLDTVWGARREQIAQQRGMASQWESQRKQAVESLTDPRDWLIKQQIARMRNPHDIGQAWQPTFTERSISPFNIPDVVKRFAPGAELAYDPAQYYRGLQTNVLMKKPLTKVGIETPSGQAWAGLMPSEKQQLAGYAEYTGKYWPDVEARMRQMLPRSPGGGSQWRPARQRV